MTSTSSVIDSGHAFSSSDAERRAWAYWSADGLPTLVASVGSLLIAFFLLFSRHRPTTPFSVTVMMTSVVLYGAILLRHRQIVEWLKAKITYPRTGYAGTPYFVDQPEDKMPIDLLSLAMQGADAKHSEDAERVHRNRKTRMAVMVVLLLAATLATIFLRDPRICAVAGIVLAAALWIGARNDQRISWLVLMGFPFIGFYLTAFLATRVLGVDRVAYFLAGGGVLFLLDGGIALIRYMGRNPAPKAPLA